MMLYIENPSTDPYFNLATEEYLLYHKREHVFMLWVNRDVIVVGRNQNTIAEINYDFVRDNHIAVVRRLTGGGAVFHDKGNLNFTFIAETGYSDFALFGGIIIGALKTLGVDAELSGRNDMTIDGRKFSGNAQTVHRGMVLHHGTLMLNIAVDTLSRALRVSPGKIAGKGVKSVRSRVTNINEHLDHPIGIPALTAAISAHIARQYPGITPYTLTAYDIAAIEELAQQKYRTWEWNFGASPKYNFEKDVKYPGGNVQVRLRVSGGMIEQARFFGDYFGSRDVCELEKALAGTRHEHTAVQAVLCTQPISEYFLGATVPDILPALF